MGEKAKHMIFPRHVLVGTDALDRLGRIIADLELESPGVVVVDATTRKLVETRVRTTLEAEGFKPHFYESTGPTMASVRKALAAGRKAKASWYIGAGGG